MSTMSASFMLKRVKQSSFLPPSHWVRRRAIARWMINLSKAVSYYPHLFPHTNATYSAAQSGLATIGERLYDFDSGDWVTYTGIWFGAVGDTARIRLQFSAFNDGGKIEARLGGVDGEIIGYFYPWNTYGEYEDAAFDIDTDVQGLQQLTFKSTSSSDV
mmetsp:Transcript_11682/g.19850  ORF Transcript_11682/g.19850 Transcript_11682/m.19850 type:complete len:159 (-) Transcript_11682:1957-2433(-)